MHVLVHGDRLAEIVTDTDGMVYLLSNYDGWNSYPHPAVGIGKWNCACRVSDRFLDVDWLITDNILPIGKAFFTRKIQNAY